MVARALSGVVAAATVLGVGELVAVAVAPAASPFYAVGSTTVDRSPAWAREFAIDTFGTNDKPALFIGMTLLIVVASIAAGLLERRRRPVGSLVLAGLGAVGVYAALSRPTATWTYAVPTIVGVVAGIVLLRLLIHTLDAEPTSEEHSRPAPGGKVRRLPRRQFILLLGAGATVAAAAGVAGRELGRRIASVAENRRLFLIPRVAAPAPPIPVGTDLAPVGATPFVTPNAEFYRIDTALQVPQLTTDEWQLRIHGLVDRPITLDWDDLTARTPVERIITLTCVSNEIGGPLAGNARWIGYPIQDLLDEVGVHADADMLLSKSVDGFTIGTPVAALRDGRDAILAVAMNGEPLPLEHGYPVRQVVPGLYGYVSATKWVVDWELTRFDRAEAYWTKRGWGVRAPIKTASRIDVPAAFAPVTAGPVTVAGTAWAQQRGVEAVEVRVDGGPWQQATLAPEYSIDTWRQWTWEWDATPGLHRLEVRATDGTGDTQPEDRVPPIPDGATGWHSSSVTVR
ncbi:molybdopterin-dependent oxidoreductase [Rhodococcus triatomae]|uniref:molybdopterin-dependent oxidoreductase n=1 Tax=Rhodococcus triatomae TaxID=300028 RepID=UPI0009F265B8|nr:molybdopterin-dependent oxidoreductase [Rhodococcus triatomae]QNG21603.1 molybdopterin-dependent oxidoreductase [Rhodococcus triatomae]QNG25658.1 molybdopterin-dependent oxidoreductase [Rhodococcus triatomae]